MLSEDGHHSPQSLIVIYRPGLTGQILRKPIIKPEPSDHRLTTPSAHENRMAMQKKGMPCDDLSPMAG
jgi:hypothetical protein